MSRELFGTDGVRGIASEYPLDDQGSTQIGKAVGVLFAEPGHTVVIGGDTRESSERIIQAIANGLTSVGVSVVRVGVIATPGLAYITRAHDEFVAGIMVTASHNPYQYNGIKIFNSRGGKLRDKEEAELNKLIESELADYDNPGKVTQNSNLRSEYIDFIIHSAGDLKLDAKIAIDTANGATSSYAASVLERLGAEVVPLFNAPNGTNINEGCGATDIHTLRQTVDSQQCDLGIALDGDADRLIMVDEQAREVKGDYIMYILAVSMQAQGVVATIMSNMGLEQALQAKGITLDRRAVGDRYVLEGLQQSGYPIGGEQSGHIIIPELLPTGDGLLAAVQVVKAVYASGKTLAQWCDEVNLLPQALVNIDLPNKSLLDQPTIRAFIDVKNSDYADKGRVLIRPSGTEPLARVMVEAQNAEREAGQIAHELSLLIQHETAKEQV